MTEQIAPSTVEMISVLVTSTLNSFETERRFPVTITLGELKKKLELLTGASSASMHVQLRNKENNLIAEMEDESSTLKSYPISDNIILHVIDHTSQAGQYEDTSKVQKYVMSDEDYSKRSESIKAFKLKHNLGIVSEEELARRNEEKEKKMKEEEELANTINVESRCEVRVTGQPCRKGMVKFVGTVHFKPGYWVGVQYDEPLGRNDGSIDGKRYFECPMKYGGFVKPKDIIIGNFPEEKINLDDEL